MYEYYCSVPGKCPHGRSTITPYFSLSWALAWCIGSLPCAKLCTQLVGGVNEQSRLQLWLDPDRCYAIASTPVLRFRQGNHSLEKLLIELIIPLPRFGWLLRIELMHDWANCLPRFCVAMFGRTCLDVSTLWLAGVQELPGRLPYMTVRI